MTVHTGKGCANGKGKGKESSETGGNQYLPTTVTTSNTTYVFVREPAAHSSRVPVRLGSSQAGGSHGYSAPQSSSANTGGSQYEYVAPINSVNCRDRPDWLQDPEYWHLAASPLMPPHGPLPRTRHDTIYLIDECPDITGTTPKAGVKPYFPFEFLKENDFVEWRCWWFIQRWRKLTHWVLRIKHKRRMWSLYGRFLNMIKDRREGNSLEDIWEGVPPGIVPEHRVREIFPNARYVDRSEPRVETGNMSRHRILGGDAGTYSYRPTKRY